MTIWQIHYDALYGSPLAVDAVLTLDDTAGTAINLRAIDKTVAQLTGFNGVDVATIGPSANVRATELAGNALDGSRLDGATLTLNGRDWRIISHQPLPAPTGEGAGEMRLTLSEIS